MIYLDPGSRTDLGRKHCRPAHFLNCWLFATWWILRISTQFCIGTTKRAWLIDSYTSGSFMLNHIYPILMRCSISIFITLWNRPLKRWISMDAFVIRRERAWSSQATPWSWSPSTPGNWGGEGTSQQTLGQPLHLLTCTCRAIPIAPSRRMLETLLLDEDSLLLTWFISSVLQVFNAVLCIFVGCFSSDFFSFASDYFHSFFSNLSNCWTFFASLVPLDSLFHGSATLTLKLFLLTSVLAYLWTRFSGSAACLVLALVVLTVSSVPLAYPSLLLHRIRKVFTMFWMFLLFSLK